MKNCFIILLLVLSANMTSVWAEVPSDYDNGISAYESFKFSKAIVFFKSSAYGGNIYAKYNLAVIYAGGFGAARSQTYAEKLIADLTESDLQTVIAYWTNLAAKKEEWAMLNLGTIYFAGIGVKADHLKAARQAKSLLKEGNSFGSLLLSMLYLSGNHFPADCNKVIDNLEDAAEAGNSYAEFILFNLYRRGKCIRQNHKKSLAFINKAADNNNLTAQLVLGVLHLNGRMMPKDSEKGMRLIEDAAQKGHSVSQTLLARMYLFGVYVNKDYKLAAHWFLRAADQFHPKAQKYLAVMYVKGLGVSKDIDKSEEYLRRYKENKDKSKDKHDYEIEEIIYDYELKSKGVLINEVIIPP